MIAYIHIFVKFFTLEHAKSVYFGDFSRNDEILFDRTNYHILMYAHELEIEP